MTDNNLQKQIETAETKTQWLNSEPDASKIVNIVISGATYPVNCPVDEIASLKKATRYINDFINDLRKEAPTLSHENLLVLCCLNMYEKMDQQESQNKSTSIQEQRMQILLDKITKDADSILTSKH
ncbi:MAG: cell division protein ZapA [Gammaproteobacteria bacterium]|nr:MAG: cell division protein ZapA [Gammaproteobacteria bacterium]